MEEIHLPKLTLINLCDGKIFWYPVCLKPRANKTLELQILLTSEPTAEQWATQYKSLPKRDKNLDMRTPQDALAANIYGQPSGAGT